MEKTLVLASASPRRSELLSLAGFEYKIIPSNADELSGGNDACFVVCENARRKAKDVFLKAGIGSVVVGADTVVCVGGEILGKPNGIEGARKMLSLLSGSVHKVLTGYSVISDSGEDFGVCETKVFFKDLTDDEIDDYIATNEPFDKAGSYAIQEKGCVFIKKIEGDYFNVIGLPVCELSELLKKHGVFPNWQKSRSENGDFIPTK